MKLTRIMYCGTTAMVLSHKYDLSLAHYLELAAALRKDFQHLKLPDEAIDCFTLADSDTMRHYPGIRVKVPAGTKNRRYTPRTTL